MTRKSNPAYDAKSDVRTKESKYAKVRAERAVGDGMSIPIELGAELRSCINAILAAGDAVMLSRTSGGGILCIAVYANGSPPEKLYARDDDELADLLAEIKAAAEG